MRIRHVAALLVAVSALGLSACSGDSTDSAAARTPDSEQASSTTPAYTPAPPTTTYRRGELTGQDRVFLSEVDDYWRVGRDADLIEIGESVCARLRSGVSKTVILAGFIDGEQGADGSLTAKTGADFNNGVNLFSASVKGYCPEFLTGVK